MFLPSHFLPSATGSAGLGSDLWEQERVSSSGLIVWVTQCGNYNFPRWVKLELRRKVGFQVAGADLGHCRGRKSWGATERAWMKRSGACSQKMQRANDTVCFFFPLLFVVLGIITIHNPEAEIIYYLKSIYFPFDNNQMFCIQKIVHLPV